MRLAMCISGEGAALAAGKVYEVSPTYTCSGASFVDVPSAPNWHVLSEKCSDCGHDQQISWLARRFVPINDVDVPADEVRKEVTA